MRSKMKRWGIEWCVPRCTHTSELVRGKRDKCKEASINSVVQSGAHLVESGVTGHFGIPQVYLPAVADGLIGY